MRPEIIRNNNIPEIYEKWIAKLLDNLGPDIAYGDGQRTLFKYSIAKPVSTVHLLDQVEYDEERKRLKKLNVMAYEPELIDYGSVNWSNSDAVIEFYKKQNKAIIDTSFGFWIPQAISTNEYRTHIYLCTSRIEELSKRIKRDLFDINNKNSLQLTFHAILLHELGHHYLLANQPLSKVKQLTSVDFEGIADSWISEGMASTFAYLLGNADTRKVLCQIHVELKQNASHRLFLFLKHADIQALLNCFTNPGAVDSAPAALNHVFGGRMNHNGMQFWVNGPYDGVAFDWSSKGAYIFAKNGIKTLCTMMDGCSITSSIDLLVGRFPRNVLIVTNEIKEHPDYFKLPNNIIIIPKSKCDLSAFVEKHILEHQNLVKRDKDAKDDDRIQKMMIELQMSDEWVKKFRSRVDEIDAELELMKRALGE